MGNVCLQPDKGLQIEVKVKSRCRSSCCLISREVYVYDLSQYNDVMTDLRHHAKANKK